MSRVPLQFWRSWLLVSASAVLVCACGEKPKPKVEEAAPPPVRRPSQTTLPPRAEGVWKMTIAEEGSAEPPQELEICIDAEVDKHLGIMGSDLSGDRCERTVSHTTADSWGILATCVVGAGVTTEYSGSVTGDFNSAYTMKLRSQTTGNSLPQMNRVANYTVNAKLTGRCDHGMVPGDISSEGFRFNLFDMAGMARSGEAQSETMMHDN